MQTQLRQCPQLLREGVRPHGIDGRDLCGGRPGDLIHIGGIAVGGTVGGVAALLQNFGVHDLHRGEGAAHKGEQVLDLGAVVQVDDGLSPSLGQKGGEADILQKGDEHHQKLLTGDGEFQMIFYLRVGKGAAGKEHPAHKGACALIAAQQLKGDALRVEHGEVVVKVDAVGHVIDGDTVGQLPGGELFLPQRHGTGHRLDALHQLGIVLGGTALTGQHLHLLHRKLTGKDHQPEGLLVGEVLAHGFIGKDLILGGSGKGGHSGFLRQVMAAGAAGKNAGGQGAAAGRLLSGVRRTDAWQGRRRSHRVFLPPSRSGVGRLVQGAGAGAAPFGSAESRELRSRARLRRAGCARLPAPRRDGQRGSRRTRRRLIRYT